MAIQKAFGEPVYNSQERTLNPTGTCSSYSCHPWQLEEMTATLFRGNIFTKLEYSNWHPNFFRRKKPDKFI